MFYIYIQPNWHTGLDSERFDATDRSYNFAMVSFLFSANMCSLILALGGVNEVWVHTDT